MSLGRQSAARDVVVRPGSARTWVRAGRTMATGWAYLGHRRLHAEELAATVDRTSAPDLSSLFEDFRGQFALVKQTDEATHAVVDHVRGIPLFVADGNGRCVVTDDVEVAAEAAGTAGAVDWRNLAELLMALYVTGSETLADGVRQVEAGTELVIPSSRAQAPVARSWYAFRPNLVSDSTEDLVERGREALSAAMARAVAAAADAPLVVPLSGGIDSRLLVQLLVRHVDPDRVLAYTYGAPGNRDVATSRTVAASLGLRWEFVPYSLGTWRTLRRQPWWRAYLRRASSLSAIPNLHDLPALGSLRERGVVPQGAVALPGHTGDFLAGSWLPGALARRASGDRRHVVDAVLTSHYRLRTPAALARLLGCDVGEVTAALRARVEASLPATRGPLAREELVSLAEQWAWKERQAKFIVNACRAYEHHGLGWSLPWWDREVVDFWAQVPLDQRRGMGLRRRIAASVGVEPGVRSRADRLESVLTDGVRRLGVEAPVKRARILAKRARRSREYHHHPLAWYGLVDENRFRQWYSGRETGWAFLGEEIVEAFSPGALRA